MFGSQQRAEAQKAFELRLDGMFYRLETLETAPRAELTLSPGDPQLTDIHDRLNRFGGIVGDLDRNLKEFQLALSEGIERVDRADRRIKATVARARKELKDRGYEDPGLEAEAHELRIVDGDGGEQGELPTVPSEVEQAAGEPSSIRGVSASTLQRVRGL